MPPSGKNSKPILKSLSPFTETKWPEISHDDQQVILDLVCNLISPLGDHRKTHTHPSKGKKRKRSTKEEEKKHASPPPTPEIHKHILIGINSITRHLEALAAHNAPSTMPVAIEKKDQKESQSNDQPTQELQRYPSVLILTHPKPSLSPPHAHFPTLIHLTSPSSSSSSSHTTPRLIPLATSSDARLASALNIPRVGALAIFKDAPGAKVLEDFVRERVGVTGCMWIDEAMSAEWKGVNVKAG
ncbi:hypothetical protein GQ44DRAFT_618365 [Phaeosphaeriaceae sp. PMI808]|nr:hypothetical protein GQ44DRAFT_618365 [Phaeosphaeriaceae sp. PMI808]